MNPTCHIHAQNNIKAEMNFVRRGLEGKYVTLKRGRKYKGRKALVTDIYLNSNEEIMALAMVLRKPTKNNNSQVFLNSKTETRRYWKIDDLEWDI